MENIHPNEILIESISDELVKHHSRFAARYEDFEDYSEKGEFITKIYPWPISEEIRRLIGGEHFAINDQRLTQVFTLAERSMQFLSFCLLADLWDNIEKHKLVISPGLQNQLKGFKTPSMGHWVGIIRAALKMLNTLEEGTFFDYSKIDTMIVDDAEKIVNLRNKKVHERTELDFVTVEELVAKMLQKLSFLTTYKMLAVKDIRVIASRLVSPSFKHNFSLLNSNSSNFKGEAVHFSEFTESHAVLLMKDYKASKTYLNLFPFVIDTAAYYDDELRKPPKGIFSYIGGTRNKLTYMGTQPPTSVDFSTFGFGETLSKEFDLFYKTFAS